MKITFHIHLKTLAQQWVESLLARYHEFNYESQVKYVSQLGIYASTYLPNEQKPVSSVHPGQI
jgi:hypothetical protein